MALATDEKGNVVVDDSASLWAGHNNEQVNGDDLGAMSATPMSPLNVIKKNINFAFPTTATQTATATSTTGAGFSLSDIINKGKQFAVENKWLLLIGAAGVIAYIMFAGRGSKSEYTTITKYQ